MQETPNGKGSVKTVSKLHYIKPRIKEWENFHNSCRQFEVKLGRLRIGCTRLTHKHLMTRNNQEPTYMNVACGNQKLTIKHCLPNGGTAEKKYIQGNKKILLGRDCKVEKVIRFLRYVDI